MNNDPTFDLQPDLAIQGGFCVLPSPNAPHRLITEQTSIAVKDGKIVAINPQAHKKAARVLRVEGLHVLPGFIDSQVHFREPGLTHKEDLEAGTRSAVLGGVTTVYEMPNTTPPTVSADAFADKLKLAKGRVWCDIAFFIGATAENIDDLPHLERQNHCCAVKIFMGSSTGNLLVADDETLLNVLKKGQRRVAVHCEDETRLQERRGLAANSDNVLQHPVWRDELTALTATQRLVTLARKANRRVHVLHVTTAEEIEFLKSAKDIATVETTPQHLTLSAPECYERLGTLAQMNPPIRSSLHRAALWKGVQDGTVTVIGSDHAPHTLEEKARPYPESPSGMTGVQTLLPLLLNHVHAKRLSLNRLVELCSLRPSQLYGATAKGEIRIGNDADFTIVDLSRQQTITNKWIASRCGWTPFDGMKVTGWPHATVVRGRTVMLEDEVLGNPIGEPIHFSHPSAAP